MNQKDSVNTPFLPDINSNHRFTLVLDLDETLIHSNIPENIFKIRPYGREFLEEISKYYEVVIFTSGTEEYADKVLDCLDKDKKYITHRLYRQHVSTDDESHYKDLDKLGRDLCRTIIVDNMPHNFKYNKNNGLYIKSWKDDPDDNQLLGLCRLLKRFASKNVNDVRPIIKAITHELDKETIKSVDNPYDLIDLNNLPL